MLKPIKLRLAPGVMQRITDTVSGSSVEEGGKLLGRIEENSKGYLVDIETTIDSGPKVDKSASHIFPDGEYQERLFRVVEHFDPTIDHIGSWHSHHCNGLDRLSSGDIRGYRQSIEDSRYLSQLFVAILVTGLHGSRPILRYYVFIRGERDFYELDPKEHVSQTTTSHFTELMLRQMQAFSSGILTTQRRDQSHFFAPKRPKPKVVLSSHLMNEIRVADDYWFKKNCPQAKTLWHKAGQVLTWMLTTGTTSGKVEIRYEHPSHYSEGAMGKMIIHHNGKLESMKDIPLDSTRFAVLREYFCPNREQKTKRDQTKTKQLFPLLKRKNS